MRHLADTTKWQVDRQVRTLRFSPVNDHSTRAPCSFDIPWMDNGAYERPKFHPPPPQHTSRCYSNCWAFSDILDMTTQTKGNYLSNLGGGGSNTEAGARINKYEIYVQKLSFAVAVSDNNSTHIARPRTIVS